MDSKGLSVIVATRNRAERLSALVTSFAGEWGETSELCIVDNGSSDDTRAVLEHECAKQPKLRALHLPEPGKSAALNAAIAAVRGPYLAFLDDDVILQPGWAAAMLRAFESTTHAGYQGRIRLAREAREDPEKRALAERYRTPALTDHGSGWREVKSLAGANMALRRSVLEEVGGFDERLGPGRAGSDEDTELSRRIRRNGGRFAYVGDACVEHGFEAHRMNDAHFEAHNRQLGRSRLLYREKGLVTSVVPNLLASAVRSQLARWVGAEESYWRNRGRYFTYSEMLRVLRERRPRA